MLVNTSLEQINAGSTVVVANNRQLVAFRNSYWQRQKSAVCQQPKIVSWQTLLLDLYQQISDAPYLISPFVEQVLWQSIIAEDNRNQTINNVKQLAEKAARDYRTLRHYELDIKSKYLKQPFYRWLKTYQTMLQDYGLMDSAQLIPLILSHATVLPTTLFIYGFSHFNRQQQRFLNNIDHCILPQKQRQNVIQTAVFGSIEDEIDDTAQWLKQHRHRDQSMAVVVAQLPAVKDQLTTAFDEALTDQQTTARPYHISLAEPLCHYPLVKAALAMIDFSSQYQKKQCRCHAGKASHL